MINRGFSVRRQPTCAFCFLLIWPGLQYRTGTACVARLHAKARAGSSSLYGLTSPEPEVIHTYVVQQTVFFGANDACLPGSHTDQHVPLEFFKQNLIDILKHSSVIAQKPRLILVTPPPVNEYQLEEWGLREGITKPVRTAEYTKRYADATREIGDELGVTVLDIWSIFMKMTGWQDGEPLVGSKKVARSEILENLLVDGMLEKNKRCQISNS